MREIIKVSKNNPDQKIIEKTSKLLKAGKIVVLPTDTVYGLCIKAEIENSIEKLSEIKGRPPKKGVPLIIGKIDQLFDYTNPISAKKLEFLKCFWPGPVTFVFERKKNFKPTEDGIAIRLPEQKLCRKIAEHAGPFLATSANKTGEPILDNIKEISLQLRNVQFFLDAGTTKENIASTIVSLQKDSPKLIREGKVPFKKIVQSWNKI